MVLLPAPAADFFFAMDAVYQSRTGYALPELRG
jgi:hypothetical protein